ncbi:hypothetical protein ACF06X_33815 [Streptomyces sp. NPDC015346]|uniref:hypothetical protein n=1 Tax=Streptomyces sp. NPDC015346 TaxID=3364954 RepID=UPI0036F738C7
MDAKAARDHLTAKYPLLLNADDAQLVHAISSSDFRVEWRNVAIRHDWDGDPDRELPPVTAEDTEAALVILADLRKRLDAQEKILIDTARDRKVSWPRIAQALGLSSPQGAQQRRKRLDAKTWLDSLLDPSRRNP